MLILLNVLIILSIIYSYYLFYFNKFASTFNIVIVVW
jgi:hypothetical protein